MPSDKEKFSRTLNAKRTPKHEVDLDKNVKDHTQSMLDIKQISDMGYKELQQKAKDLGLPYHRMTKEDLQVSISTAQGPETATKPE